jgi:hypothetical protein
MEYRGIKVGREKEYKVIRELTDYKASKVGKEKLATERKGIRVVRDLTE